MSSVAGVRCIDGSVVRPAFQKCMARVPSDEKIRAAQYKGDTPNAAGRGDSQPQQAALEQQGEGGSASDAACGSCGGLALGGMVASAAVLTLNLALWLAIHYSVSQCPYKLSLWLFET